MTTTNTDPLSQANLNLIGRVRAANCEPGANVEAYELAQLAADLVSEVKRLQIEVVRRDGWRKAKDAEHAMNTRGWRERIGDLERSLANALDGSALGRVEALYQEAAQTAEEPADGTLVQLDERWVYVRTDREADQRHGDWWPTEADPEGQTVHPLTFGEILGLDDPPEDRVRHDVEVLIPAYILGFALHPPREV